MRLSFKKTNEESYIDFDATDGEWFGMMVIGILWMAFTLFLVK